MAVLLALMVSSLFLGLKPNFLANLKLLWAWLGSACLPQTILINVVLATVYSIHSSYACSIGCILYVYSYNMGQGFFVLCSYSTQHYGALVRD